jgi:hypothetical protein
VLYGGGGKHVSIQEGGKKVGRRAHMKNQGDTRVIQVRPSSRLETYAFSGSMLISSFPIAISHAEFHCSKVRSEHGININVGETLTLTAPSISQTWERFWIDEEGRDKIYGGQPCRFDCAGPATIEVRRAEGALFPVKVDTRGLPRWLGWA